MDTASLINMDMNFLFLALVITATLQVVAKEIVWARYDDADNGPQTSLVSSEINKHGITITSVRVHDSSDMSLPPWVYTMIPVHMRNLHKDSYVFRGRDRDTRPVGEGSFRSCYIECFGAIPKTKLSESVGNLTVSSFHFDCLFVHSWVRREGLVAGDTMRPLYTICAPSNITSADDALLACNSIIQSSEPLHSNLTLLVEKTKRMHSYFTITAPKVLNRPRPRKNAYDLGVVATAPYIDTNLNAGILIANWIFHHIRLGFRVYFYDRNGSYANIIQSSIDKFVDKNSGNNDELKHQLIYHRYTIRELLGYDDFHQRHARTDQDKALTYSHCRFEYQTRRDEYSSGRDVKNLLVIDFDEFVFCPSVAYNPGDQLKGLLSIVNSNRHTKADEFVFGRFAVHNVSDLNSCLKNTFDANQSAFICYNSWITGDRHSTIKSMHHSFLCPSTDFHFACTSVCVCERHSQNTCALFHFRPLYSQKNSVQSPRPTTVNEVKHRNDSKQFRGDDLVREELDSIRSKIEVADGKKLRSKQVDKNPVAAPNELYFIWKNWSS